ncbi:exported hypothetical protein [Bradyrhizobium sp. STM 3843]|uniref:DUF1330 domain-containing protein n=1 Tax=Bradyrhizobium sp. STM 3843 TaxID=551947 RepID=UPI00024036C9|nr:DUF1330 domain-containing protein [Bradyrhizobium sp. STM 3843]CCE09585.1 exported hypothetical protein [Bradyrhizobium sp. STM 3843]
MKQSYVAIGLAIALTAAPSSPTLARGGFGHIGHGGFGHTGLGHMGLGHIGPGGGGEGRGEAIITPTYVLISTARLNDKDAFINALHGLADAVLPFEGRVVSDVDNPPSWDGTAAAHVTMLQFDSADAAQRWKDSDAYKSFDEQLKRTSESSIRQLQGQPVARPADMANARFRGRRGLDPKAYEPLVKEYDTTLSKMHGICHGC